MARVEHLAKAIERAPRECAGFVSCPAQFLEGIDATQPFITQFMPLFIHQPIGCRLFVDAIIENRAIVPSFYEGWKAQQIIDAAIVSHETKQWVAV